MTFHMLMNCNCNSRCLPCELELVGVVVYKHLESHMFMSVLLSGFRNLSRGSRQVSMLLPPSCTLSKLMEKIVHSCVLQQLLNSCLEIIRHAILLENKVSENWCCETFSPVLKPNC